MLSATEFRAGDGGGDGDIQTVGCGALMEVGNEQPTVYTLSHGIADAVTLVAHDDEPVVGQFLAIDVLSVEECAVDGEIRWQLAKEIG